MKKLGLVITFLLFAVVLTSCAYFEDLRKETPEELTMNTDLLKANITERIEGPKAKTYEMTIRELEGYTVTTNHAPDGIVFVQNAAGHRGAYSFPLDRFIVPVTSGAELTIRQVPYFGTYINVFYSIEGERAVFDLLGNTPVERDRYSTISITSEQVLVPDENGEFRSEYVEVIQTLTSEDSSKGLVATIKKYLVDPKTGERTEYKSLMQEPGNNLSQMFTDPLMGLGLDDYELRFIHENLFVFDKESEELIRTLTLANTSMLLFMDQHFIQQNYTKVHEDEEDYSYIHQDQRYRVQVKQVHLLTGEEKLLDLDYLITQWMPFVDEEGAFTYAYIAYRPFDEIENDVSPFGGDGPIYRGIINKDGEIVATTPGLNLMAMAQLGDHHYFDREKEIVYDKELTPLYSLGDSAIHNYTFVLEHQLIVMQYDGQYGAIHFNGNVVIPFIYRQLYPEFHNGRTYATDESSRGYLVSVNNQVTPLQERTNYLVPNAYSKRGPLKPTNYATFDLFDFNRVGLENFENARDIAIYRIHNYYYEAVYIQMNTVTGRAYVTFTAKEVE